MTTCEHGRIAGACHICAEVRENEALDILRDMATDMRDMLGLMRTQASPQRRMTWLEKVNGPCAAGARSGVDPAGPEMPSGWPDFFEITDPMPFVGEGVTTERIRRILDSMPDRASVQVAEQMRMILKRIDALELNIENLEGKVKRMDAMLDRLNDFGATLAGQADTLADRAKEVGKVIGVAADKVNGMASETAPAPSAEPEAPQNEPVAYVVRCQCAQCVADLKHRQAHEYAACMDVTCVVCLPDPR